jgi:hypothetical protein
MFLKLVGTRTTNEGTSRAYRRLPEGRRFAIIKQEDGRKVREMIPIM